MLPGGGEIFFYCSWCFHNLTFLFDQVVFAIIHVVGGDTNNGYYDKNKFYTPVGGDTNGFTLIECWWWGHQQRLQQLFIHISLCPCQLVCTNTRFLTLYSYKPPVLLSYFKNTSQTRCSFSFVLLRSLTTIIKTKNNHV